ncbi:MAG: THUMP domain-containing protein [Nitrososphaerota archaeon]
MSSKYLFLLSGFHQEIPFAELRAVLEVLDPNHKILEKNGRVVIIETEKDCAREAVLRTAYTKLSTLLISRSPTIEEEIINSLDIQSFREILPPKSKIAVRGISLGSTDVDVPRVEKNLGEVILRNVPAISVDLKNPEYTILFIAQENTTYIGVLVEIKPKKFFYDRVAGRRPFKLPSAMQPDTARCLVNLSRTKPGGRILDPFSGTGGIIIEAILLGYETYGVELKKWIARGSLKNLYHYTPGRGNIVIGDSRQPPFRKGFDGIVTDPPYGRSTTIPDKSLEELMKKFFENSRDLLRNGGRISMAAPTWSNIEDYALDSGYRILEKYTLKIHKSLVRKIMVFT